jgi:hypothetical protein
MKPIRIVAVITLSGCAAFTTPDPTNLATYCTEATGYRVGYLSMAYYGVCPKATEPAFLAGLERGRLYAANPPQALPYYARMEQTEKQLRAASGAERERLIAQLRDIDAQLIRIVNDPGSYAGGR